MRVAICLPAYGGRVHAQVAISVAQDLVWAARQGWEHAVFTVDMHGVARARNAAVANAIANGCDLLLMQDADVWPMDPPALARLVRTAQVCDAAVVGAAVALPRRGIVNCEPALPGDVYDGDVGTGYMLLDLRRLAAMPRPWFRVDLAEDGIAVVAGEDVNLCRLARSCGHRAVVDYTLRMAHSYEQAAALDPRDDGGNGRCSRDAGDPPR